MPCTTSPIITTSQAYRIALLVAVTFFMENLDATVIATALPQMAQDFSVTAVDVNIGITAFLLSVAVFIPLSGWLADRFGERRIFASAIVLFTLSSLLCGLSQSLLMFTFSRILQGIGGALMVPVGRLLVLRVTEKQELVRMIALITWPGLVAPVLGPPLGGLIVTVGHWSWIFWLNIPLGILALLCTFWLIPPDNRYQQQAFDLRGFLLTAFSCAALITGLEWLGQNRLLSGALFLALGIISGALAWRHARQATLPVIALDAMSIPSFLNAQLGGSLFRAAICAIPFLLPLLFQISFGLSAVEAGSLVLWVFAGNLAMKPFTTAIMRRWGFRRVMLVNGVISTAAVAVCAFITVDMPWPWLALVLFVGGLSRSMQFTCYNSLGFADVPPTQMSAASTLYSLFSQLSMSAGIAFAALALRVSMTLQSHPQPQQNDFCWAFLAISMLSLLALLDNLRLKTDAGEHILRRKN